MINSINLFASNSLKPKHQFLYFLPLKINAGKMQYSGENKYLHSHTPYLNKTTAHRSNSCKSGTVLFYFGPQLEKEEMTEVMVLSSVQR